MKERWSCKSAFCLKDNRASASGGRTTEVEDEESGMREKMRRNWWRKNLGLSLTSIVQMGNWRLKVKLGAFGGVSRNE